MITQPQAIPATTPLSVKLEAQQWNSVIALLQEVLAPNRVTTPLIQAISEQVQAEAQQHPAATATAATANGLDHDAERRGHAPA
jgi:hypothetical protein